MVVDPPAPRFELHCTALVGDRSNGSDPNLIVEWYIDVSNFTGILILVPKSDVAPFTGLWDVSEVSQYGDDLPTGEYCPNHHSAEKIREIAGIIASLDPEICEKSVGIIDLFSIAIFEGEHFGELYKRFGTAITATLESGFEILGRDRAILLVDELDTLGVLGVSGGCTRHT